MRKLIYLLIVLIFILVTSCQQNSSEKSLYGQWYGIDNDGYTRMHFYADSLVFTEEFKESVSWSANESKIEFSLPSNLWLESSAKVTLEYEISKYNDTLFCVFNGVNGQNSFNLLKATNYFIYLNKRYKTKFSLPEGVSKSLLKRESIYGLKVFMGISENGITAKTEISENLNDLESDIKSFKDSIKPFERSQIENHSRLLDQRFHLRVFADKNITDSTITSYLKATIKSDYPSSNANLPENLRGVKNDTSTIRIYRVYKSEEVDDLRVLKGNLIQSNAIFVYN